MEDYYLPMQEAAIAEEQAYQSPEEKALLMHQPAPDAPLDEQMFFKMQLLQCKQLPRQGLQTAPQAKVTGPRSSSRRLDLQ